MMSSSTINTDRKYNIKDFKKNIAFSTNTLDWIIVTPNIGLDYDIVKSPYKKMSVGIDLKYRWKNDNDINPYYFYNLFNVNADFRYYWRLHPLTSWESEWLSVSKGFHHAYAVLNCYSSSPKLKEGRTSKKAFYIGPKISFSQYNLKLSEKGRQGTAFGIGITGGFALPLYGYKDGSALDLDIGGSIGWVNTNYDMFVNDTESNCYPYIGSEKKTTWYPLVSEARISIVYRFGSISKQITEIDTEKDRIRKIQYDRLSVTDLSSSYNDSIKTYKLILDEENKEIAQWKKEHESIEGFDETLSLELLKSTKYKLSIPKRFTKHASDTVMVSSIITRWNNYLAEHKGVDQIPNDDPIRMDKNGSIDSIQDIKDDYIYTTIREYIKKADTGISDSILDDLLVKAYEKLATDDNHSKTVDISGKPENSYTPMRRFELIQEIFNKINEEIEGNNNQVTQDIRLSYSNPGEKLNLYHNGSKKEKIHYHIDETPNASSMSVNQKTRLENQFKKEAYMDFYGSQQKNK